MTDAKPADTQPADTRPNGSRVQQTAPEAQREPEFIRRLRRRGFRWLIVADAVALFGSMALINTVRFGFHWPRYSLGYYAAGFAIATAIHLVTYYFGGLYEHETRIGVRARLPRIAGLTVIAVLLDALAALLTGRYLMPRYNLAALVVVASLALASTRRLSRLVRLHRGGPPRVFVVGAPDDVETAQRHLQDSDWAAQIVGSANRTDDRLADQIRSAGATDVLLVTSGFMDRMFPEPIDSFEHRGIGVLQRVGAQESMLGLREAVEVAGMPFVPLRSHTLPVSRAHFKRVLELTALLLALPIVLPVAGAVALYVRMVAGKGILLRQVRVGKDARPFTMCKFRTMVRDAEEGVGPILAKRGDPRIIPACQWLRDTRLDEIPNLWNVLLGEMSIVGPRPERPELTAQLEQLIPGYHRRHEIPPGITGLAQVKGSYHTDPAFKLGHDLQYLVNWSPVLDLEIAVRTLWVIVARRV
jgi:lipopolysaccharide/colanic/teichoic acid biosynthesis glycosyltransferase